MIERENGWKWRGRRERASREAYRLSARSFFTGEARNRVARDVEKIRETRVGPSDLHMKATVFWPASLSLSRLAENSSPFRREGKRWRCCLGRFRVVNTINEGAFNGCTSSREAEKGDGGILGIARLLSGAICMCNWMLETMLSVSFDVDSWGLRDFLAFHRVL